VFSPPIFKGLTRSDAALTDPAGETQLPQAAFASAMNFQASTTVSFNAAQRAIVTADVQMSDSSSATSTVQAAVLDLPAGAACGGSGTGIITLSVSDQGQPLGVELSGSCGSGSDAIPLTFGLAGRVCVTLARYVLTYAQSKGASGYALLGSDGSPLPDAAPPDSPSSATQVCGLVLGPGSYLLGVTFTTSSASHPPGTAGLASRELTRLTSSPARRHGA
jgi:hypothetical protein